jgi:iron complex transport system ATP-binding protein
VIEAHDITVKLGGRHVLDRVSCTIPRGALVCLLGPNGAGKTTLLKAIAGLVPHAGRLTIEGREIATMTAVERARTFAYLPQGHVAHWPISAREAVAIGRIPHGAGAGRLSASDTAAIDRALAATDATHLADRPITALSGGERGRVMLARALAVEAPVLLADEPIAALDPAHQLVVMALLARAATRGTTVIAAIHDLTLATRFGQACLVLSGGRLAGHGPPREVLGPELLADVFGIAALHLEHDGKPLVVPWLTQAELSR